MKKRGGIFFLCTGYGISTKQYVSLRSGFLSFLLLSPGGVGIIQYSHLCT